MRWVSLTPETTQWVYAVERGTALIGRSHLCTEPPSVLKLPICTRPGSSPTGWEAHLGPYAPDFGVLSTLRPEGVLTFLPSLPPDTTETDLIALLQRAVGYDITILSLQAVSWEKLRERVEALGTSLKASNAARRWMTENTQRREALLSSVRTLTHRPSVAFLQPSFPLRPITPWASQLADWGGLRPCLTDKAVGWETLLEVDPEIIVFSVEGGTLAEAGEALATWARQPAVQSLQAFRAKRLYAFKGTAGLFYPAPTIVAAAEALYELAHTPTYRHNRHLGQLWAPLL